jgi:plastocyanin
MFKVTRLQQLAAFGGVMSLCVACSTSVGNGHGGLPNAADSGLDAGNATQYTITISDFEYSPADIIVLPGKVVTVWNRDLEAHTVTSEAAVDDFSPGDVEGIAFDTGLIPRNSMAHISIVDTAASGTVIPYYCAIHGSAMAQGAVTIQ